MLARYIKDLLYRNETVIIPNFGAITSKIVSAKIDEENNTFIPPTKVLKFDPSLTENDGLLMEYISKVDNSSIEVAENFIKFETDEWKEKIENGTLAIEDLGEFTLNSSGNIQFEQATNSQFFREDFGLDDVNNVVAHHEVPDTLTEEKIVREKPKKTIRKKEKIKETSWVNIFIYGFIFLIIGGFGWFFTQTIIDNNARVKAAQEGLDQQGELIKNTMQDAIFEINKALPTLTLKYINNVAIDTLLLTEQAIDSTRVKSQLNAVTDPKDPKKEELLPQKDTTAHKTLTSVAPQTPTSANRNQIAENARKFWIIEGVYKDPSNAINKIRELIQKGYKGARIVPKEGANSYVAYVMYNTFEEADQELQKIKKTNPEVWILGN